MAGMEPESIDAIVTDPPYGLGFMGKEWDALPPGREWADECLRVLKPGGHLVAFGGTRTYHRLAVAIEDAGFEIRDQIAWMYGSGFPKSHNLPGGFGTALKPAHEPIALARKPLTGTVAANVQEYGTGALNIDGCRVGIGGGLQRPERRGKGQTGGWANYEQEPGQYGTPEGMGRWPANLLLDPEAGAMLDEQSGERRSSGSYSKGARKQGDKSGAASIPIDGLTSASYADAGCASRFFYTAKASRAERNAGLDGFEKKPGGIKNDSGRGFSERDPYAEIRVANHHPTVKPIDLMRWLVRLVTPPGGTVLDPFTGSGTTGIAAHLEGFAFVGIEREDEYRAIAEARIKWWQQFEGDTAEILQRAGLAEKAQKAHDEAGQLGLLDAA
jgi:site-specific DNA-methyltransferase (adenine-specific)